MFSSNQSNVAAVAANYIEDVFSTYLYTGNGSTQTITNNIDLSTKGGLTWIKSRTNTSGGATSHVLVDTVRGSSKWLASDATSSETTNANLVTGFTTSGFSVGNAPYWGNENAIPYVSWTFRKQPKFFDVVTYTGDGSTARNISHSLGSTPGSVIVKNCTDTTDWWVWHRAAGSNDNAKLNTTGAFNTSGWIENVTSTTFGVSRYSNANDTNINGKTYVAYIFAHDAGGFGLAGTDNVISCGSFTGDGTNVVNVNLGYEPQWVMFKGASGAYGNAQWTMIDNMRGMTTLTGSGASLLKANTADAESVNWPFFGATATGFQVDPAVTATGTFIYIACRRGPMKVPTLGTSVFSPITSSASTGTAITTSFPVSLQVVHYRPAGDNVYWIDRLRGVNSPGVSVATPFLTSDNTNAESTTITASNSWDNLGFKVPGAFGGASYVYYNFQRAPSFFDEVCYTGTGVNRTLTHNLAAVPEMMIVKSRSLNNWIVYHKALGNTSACVLELDSSVFNSQFTLWNSTTPTSTVFTVGTSIGTNTSAENYVAYLFATCAGVSKVGSYTGNGTTQTIDCGFGAGGARFVLIKRTDASGDWYTYDTARGMTVLTDPYLFLNSTAAEVATLGSVTTVSTGFALNSSILAAINVNAGTYIFLAIA